MRKERIKKLVREGYGKVAKQSSPCCVPATTCCNSTSLVNQVSRRIGYSEDEIKAVPDGSNLGLGCGNPLALAALREGETVLDLGSGAGFDCFLAAQKVGSTGRIIGVDMTPEMLERARENARKGNYHNVEFRLGEVEHLPVADSSIDVIISNCVINLAPDKKEVFREAYRVLKPGGRLMISDIVLLKPLPMAVQQSDAAYIGCLSGAIMKGDYIAAITAAGFKQVDILDETPFHLECLSSDPTVQGIMEDMDISRDDLLAIGHSIVSIKVAGIKPSGQ